MLAYIFIRALFVLVCACTHALNNSAVESYGLNQNPQEYRISDIVQPDEQNLPVDPRVNKIVAPYYYQLGGYLARENRRILPGAAVMVRNNDEVVHVGYYGYANIETQQKITPDTIF